MSLKHAKTRISAREWSKRSPEVTVFEHYLSRERRKNALAHLDPVQQRFWLKVDKKSDCWEYTGSTQGAYGQFYIRIGVRTSAHRFSWQIHFGEIPAGMFVCHHCDNPICVRPDHLFLGTPQDNVNDKMRKGRYRVPVLIPPPDCRMCTNFRWITTECADDVCECDDPEFEHEYYPCPACNLDGRYDPC